MLGIGTTARAVRLVVDVGSRSFGRAAMTSIERTAYPRFGRVITARELDALGPLLDEIQWARERSRSDEHLLALVLALKCFQRLGHFPREDRVPEAVVERVRSCLGLAGTMVPDAARLSDAHGAPIAHFRRILARPPYACAGTRPATTIRPTAATPAA